MKILFVASRLPCPPVSGDRIRAHHYIKRLAQRHDLAVVAPRWRESDEEVAAARSLCGNMRILPMSLPEQLVRLGRGLFRGSSLQSCFFWNPRIEAEIGRLASTFRPDLAHVSMLRMAPAVARLLRDTPVVVDFIDAMSLNMTRRAEMEKAPWIRWLLRLEAGRTRVEEQDLIRRHRAITVVSAEDRRALGGHANVHVLPLGIDTDLFSFSRSGRSERLLLFTGNLAYFPNADAVGYLLNEILPRVQARVEDVRVRIVGFGLGRKLKRLGERRGAEMRGNAPDLRPDLGQAAVAVAPMRCGTGMQFKVLEAMASGAPVVATPLALGGLRVAHERELLIADSPEAFADEVVRLLQDPSLRETLALNARAQIEKDFTWEKSVEQLEKVYKRVLAGA